MSAGRGQVMVVGAGPAGVAAACAAAEAGRSVVLVDEQPGAGGQIWRHLGGGPPAAARPWLERLGRSGAEVISGASVFEASASGGAFRVAALRGGARLDLEAERLILATGARELLLPFPGWTLPLVTGAGGAQALCKAGLPVRGRRVALAGSGPLLLAVGEALSAAGAEVVAIAEQARAASLARLGPQLALRPGKLAEALRFGSALAGRVRTGWWPLRAEGSERVEAVVLTDGRREERIGCELLGVSWGLVPALELAQHLGARLAGGAVAVDARQETSLPGLFAAGEACGVAGAEAALAEGQIAGLAAAGREPERPLLSARRAARRFAAALDRAFALRPEVLRPPPPDTVVCRCEDVRAGQLDPAWTAREAKLAARAGMGPCQGRVCGAALSRLYGWELPAPRSPLSPVPLAALIPEGPP